MADSLTTSTATVTTDNVNRKRCGPLTTIMTRSGATPSVTTSMPRSACNLDDSAAVARALQCVPRATSIMTRTQLRTTPTPTPTITTPPLPPGLRQCKTDVSDDDGRGGNGNATTRRQPRRYQGDYDKATTTATTTAEMTMATMTAITTMATTTATTTTTTSAATTMATRTATTTTAMKRPRRDDDHDDGEVIHLDSLPWRSLNWHF